MCRMLEKPSFKDYDWDLTPKQAVQVQKELRAKVVLQPFKRTVHTIAGADISFDRFATVAYAAFVVLDSNGFSVVDRSYSVGELRFPYVPGLLSFREIPLLLEAWARLGTKPDILFMDGQGIAHPRRLGIATHFGILTNFPTVGCAKSRLTGFFREPKNETKSYTELLDGNERIGFAYRTKKNTSPIFVSPGNRIDFESTLKVLNSIDYPYRIPEPTRQAHIYANQLRIQFRKH